jgi:hypothetical protein
MASYCLVILPFPVPMEWLSLRSATSSAALWHGRGAGGTSGSGTHRGSSASRPRKDPSRRSPNPASLMSLIREFTRSLILSEGRSPGRSPGLCSPHPPQQSLDFPSRLDCAQFPVHLHLHGRLWNLRRGQVRQNRHGMSAVDSGHCRIRLVLPRPGAPYRPGVRRHVPLTEDRGALTRRAYGHRRSVVVIQPVRERRAPAPTAAVRAPA